MSISWEFYETTVTKQCTELIEQLVLPKPCRQKVLKVSHNIPLVCGMWYVDSDPRTWDQLLPYLLFCIPRGTTGVN